MTREKVIKGLECHISKKCETDAVKHEICPYWEHDDCGNRLMCDALELLKEQEPVKAVAQGDDSYMCDNCGETVGWEEMKCYGFEKVKYKYCPYCGRKVMWDVTAD